MRLLLMLLISSLSVSISHGRSDSGENQTNQSQPGTKQIMIQQELSWSIRSQIPGFSVMAWYAGDDAEKRFARINGEVYLEGDEIDGGLKLLEVHKKELIFTFNGTKFRYLP